MGGFFYAKKSKCCRRFGWKKIVVSHDIIFKKKQYVEWKDVKAKANAVQGIPEMMEIATGGNYKAGEVDHYNVFHTSLLIRHSEEGKKQFREQNIQRRGRASKRRKI